MPPRILSLATIGVLVECLWVGAAALDDISWIRLPEGAMQPELVRDRTGHLQAVWLSGPAGASDVQVADLGTEGRLTTPPLRVNSQPGSAIAMGTIRGARMAVGSDGTLHLLWNGSGTATPRSAKSSPLLYSRKPPGAAGFEPQRNLMGSTVDLDGGGDLVVDGRGTLHVFWHAGDGKSPTREDRRRVYESVSRDGGVTFEPEHPVDPGDGTGVCGCCGIRAAVDAGGNAFVLYRGARELVHRGTQLLESASEGSGFQRRLLQEWTSGACPMSLPALNPGGTGIRFAWETGGEIWSQGRRDDAPTLRVPGPGARHPSLASNALGESLLVWTEGTGWNRGGSLGWRIFDAQGKPTAAGGTRPDVPVWSFPAVATRSDGTFVIAY